MQGGSAAGWYPDPWRVAPLRWWDGTRWTGHLAGNAWPSDPGRIRADHGGERSMRRWAQWATLGGAALVACGLIGSVLAGHAIHAALDRLSFPLPPSQTFPYGSTAVPGVADIVAVDGAALVLGGATAVPFLMWQHRAASVARELGYPARVGPSLGVASWFIPVVNYWFPYWALVDTLPPGHPQRPLALWSWLSWMGSQVLVSIAGATAALGSLATAIVVGLLAVGAALVAAAIGWRTIVAIGEAHDHALGPAC